MAILLIFVGCAVTEGAAGVDQSQTYELSFSEVQDAVMEAAYKSGFRIAETTDEGADKFTVAVTISGDRADQQNLVITVEELATGDVLVTVGGEGADADERHVDNLFNKLDRLLADR